MRKKGQSSLRILSNRDSLNQFHWHGMSCSRGDCRLQGVLNFKIDPKV